MINSSVFKNIVTALLALLVSSCSVTRTPEQAPAPIEAPPDYSVVNPEASSREQPNDPAYEQKPDAETPDDAGAVAAYGPLLVKADSAMAKGDFEQALSLLERARRIDPDAADIYLALARTHSSRGDFGQARANAERGLLYCNGRRQCAELRDYAK